MNDPTNEPMVTAKNVDLTNCDQEQIQYPGSIQPHGAMLVLSEPELCVLQASANTADLLGVAAESLLGRELRAVLSEAEIATLRSRLSKDQIAGAPLHILRKEIGSREFDCLAHRFDGVLILEFDARPQAANSSILDLYAELQSSIAKLGATTSLQSFLDLTAQQVRRFTEFDRVIIYKFMEDGSGWVCSEALADGLEPFLGLHYPPSDIPAPARRLFSLTWVRHQPDILYRPVPMIPENNPVTGKPLDMSYAFLRSVSVMYVDYLKNMGTHSSMVMTLMKEGKLWGMISCHHHSGPKHVPYEIRVASEFLAQTVSLLMSAKENAEHSEYKMQMQSVQAMLLVNVSRHTDFASSFLNDSPTLVDFIRSTGAACVVNGEVHPIGTTPSTDQIVRIVTWLSSEMDQHVYVTDCLSSHLPEAAAFADRCAGLLAVRFSKAAGDLLVWFRPETIQTVDWAGDPAKPVDTTDDGQRLHPRTSFALWKEMVHLKSEPWWEIEVNAARSLGRALLELVLERAERLSTFYDDLELSHVELDSFAHVAAHDLKEPLRGIHQYAQMLQKEYASQLDPEGASKLVSVIRLSKRMDELLDSLLAYSVMGRTIIKTDVDLNQVVAAALDSLDHRIREGSVEVAIPATLPTVRGDRVQLEEAYTNLISNAIKYNDKLAKRIEIGWKKSRDGQVLFVTDNGIGIRSEHYEKVFLMFQRLHDRDIFGGGTGAGLTIVKKIVGRHGGRIWAESIFGKGTTFYFTLSSGAAAATIL